MQKELAIDPQVVHSDAAKRQQRNVALTIPYLKITMKISEISVGSFYNYGGDTVEVTEIDGNTVVIECLENGEDGVSARQLKPLSGGYDEPEDHHQSGGYCEDAPCCGCCG